MKKHLLLALAVALVGCTVDPVSTDPVGFRDPATAPYRTMHTDGAYRLVPAGKVRWDTSWVAGVNIYDSARETLADVGALWVDTNWGTYTEGGDHLWKLVILANEKSKAAGLDTVYQWTGMDTSRHNWTDSLIGFRERKANGFRFPTAKEAKYLVWGGDTAKWVWGNQDPKTWAYKNLWGDSASIVRNRFGVVMHRGGTGGFGGAGAFLSMDGVFSTNVYLPLFWQWVPWEPTLYILDTRWTAPPPIFVRSDL